MALVLMLPYWSIWAPPMNPTSTKPRWAKRKASVMPGSMVARRPARISLVETGRRPGRDLGSDDAALDDHGEARGVALLGEGGGQEGDADAGEDGGVVAELRGRP